MPRGGHNKKHASVPAGPPALVKWPKAPKHFTPSEVVSWVRLGEAAMVLGQVAGSDLVLAERLAQLDARISDALANPDVKETALCAFMRLQADLLNRMGLTPQARNTIGPLSKPKKKGPLDDF